MNSYHHYAYGAVAEWLYCYAVGIDEASEDPGFHRLLLRPQFDTSLGEVKAVGLVYLPGDLTTKILEATTFDQVLESRWLSDEHNAILLTWRRIVCIYNPVLSWSWQHRLLGESPLQSHPAFSALTMRVNFN